jgi:histidinol-phosphate aminotransferase
LEKAMGLGDPAAFVRPELRALARYHLDLDPCPHKLDQNEVPWDLPRRLKRRVVERLLAADWARYPDFHSDDLLRELGELHAHPAEGVLVGNGSNELLGVALTALVPQGGEVLGAEPSFGLYRSFVLKAGGVPRFLLSGSELRLPIDALEAEVERDPRRPVLLGSPNNPTGDAVSPERVERLLERLQAPLLLDNAYGEFCQYDYRPLLVRHPHLLLFRTFSKAWSLAGVRLGYLLADPRLVAELIKVKLPYNVGIVPALAGHVVLAARREAERRVRVLLGRRPQWAAMLAAAGLEVFPSEANFLLVRCGAAERARELAATLAARGIRVRDVGAYPGLAGALRISVGSGSDLRAMSKALGVEGATPHLASPRSQPAPALGGGTLRSMQGAEERVSPPGAGGGWVRGENKRGAAPPASAPAGERCIAEGRHATIERTTGETRIRLALALAGGERRIEVPDGFFGHMLQALATHAGFGLDLEAQGDTHVDLHHTVEDVGLALGEAVAAALGERRGVVRFATAYAPLDEALARAVVDLSGRGFFVWSAPPELASAWVTARFPLTLVADFFQAFADRGRFTLHLEVLAARNGHHAAEAAFKAAALALRQAVALRSGTEEVPSTKGTLTS